MAVGNIKFENCKLVFRNFAGRADKYTPAGRRNFSVIIEDHEAAEALIADGWNLKRFKPKDEYDDPDYYLPVKVQYGNFDPKIYMIVGNNKTLLTDDTVQSLDYAEIENVDLVVRPYSWEVNGKSGIAAYVKTMYVTIAQDEFGDKYNFDNVPDIDDDDEVPFN